MARGMILVVWIALDLLRKRPDLSNWHFHSRRQVCLLGREHIWNKFIEPDRQLTAYYIYLYIYIYTYACIYIYMHVQCIYLKMFSLANLRSYYIHSNRMLHHGDTTSIFDHTNRVAIWVCVKTYYDQCEWGFPTHKSQLFWCSPGLQLSCGNLRRGHPHTMGLFTVLAAHRFAGRWWWWEWCAGSLFKLSSGCQTSLLVDEKLGGYTNEWSMDYYGNWV